jgi:hypothetical protein
MLLFDSLPLFAPIQSTALGILLTKSGEYLSCYYSSFLPWFRLHRHSQSSEGRRDLIGHFTCEILHFAKSEKLIHSWHYFEIDKTSESAFAESFLDMRCPRASVHFRALLRKFGKQNAQ